MQYILMILIVFGMAFADFITGTIKAHVKNDWCSKVMRIGGLHKLAEIVIMTAFCGLEIGIEQLGKYYGAEQFASITGCCAAVVVFVYIVLMEIVSILENYAEIEPNATWCKKITKKLRGVGESETDNKN